MLTVREISVAFLCGEAGVHVHVSVWVMGGAGIVEQAAESSSGMHYVHM